MKATETHYKGYRFRSRLEARWAVFFDALSVPWEYEPEGFETPEGWYLPDFKITPRLAGQVALSEPIYVEIKPGPGSNDADWRKAKSLALWDGRAGYSGGPNVLLLAGPPWV
jgi:hypothetical protein